MGHRPCIIIAIRNSEATPGLEKVTIKRQQNKVHAPINHAHTTSTTPVPSSNACCCGSWLHLVEPEGYMNRRGAWAAPGAPAALAAAVLTRPIPAAPIPAALAGPKPLLMLAPEDDTLSMLGGMSWLLLALLVLLLRCSSGFISPFSSG